MIQFRVEFPEDVAAALADYAALHGTTPEALLAEAAHDIVAEAGRLRALIAEAEADVAAGHVVPFDRVIPELRRIVAEGRARRAGL